MEFYISVAALGVAAILSAIISIPMLKIIQLSGYKAHGVFGWWKSTNYDVLIRYSALMLFSFITEIIYITCFSAFEWARYCAVAFYCIFAIVFVVAVRRNGANKIKFTGRMIRLFIVNLILLLAVGGAIALATYYSVYCQTLTAAMGIAVPFVALLANLITYPFEKLNNHKYVKRAKNKLKEQSPIVIGITGSYGKTTAKNLLKAMLEAKYTVLATPGSYNTPMGVCKTVNNSLNGEQVFIAELGARYKGDIKELCDIVNPAYGIITAVGDMHAETMGTRADIANVKYELAATLPDNGVLALNGYNEDCKALAERKPACKTVVSGDGVAYENLVIDGRGTSFCLVAGDKRKDITAKLLGAHIAETVCVCAAIALELGVSLDDIAAAVEKAQPVEHRLQLLESGSAVTVIDDAFNANPIGAKNALDVLKCFEGTKVIITPGFVELGALEKPSNVELGKQISAVCDYAFLVGSRAEDIKSGAVKNGMDDSKITIFASRNAAVEALKEIDGNKVVLFENDLPDNIV
ncbi:MAG: UDP-N-acetylmuramoyl-tripeptide--D-alanyl-D-alanine ligase [Clostridiales bacterium]|nr:UDP-N-acetylmuramoyl-tripeptide--D-alanyl-D-alanine ligase [Clostridiales bacterium]